MTGEAQSIMADPCWPSKFQNGIVNPITVWLDTGVKVKPSSQLINKLMVVCSGMD